MPISSRLSARGTSKSLRGLALGWTCRLAPACVKGFLPNTEDYSRDYSRAPLDYGHFFEEQVEGAEVWSPSIQNWVLAPMKLPRFALDLDGKTSEPVNWRVLPYTGGWLVRLVLTKLCQRRFQVWRADMLMTPDRWGHVMGQPAPQGDSWPPRILYMVKKPSLVVVGGNKPRVWSWNPKVHIITIVSTADISLPGRGTIPHGVWWRWGPRLILAEGMVEGGGGFLVFNSEKADKNW